MDFSAACRTLEVQAPFTEKELRAAYYRRALQFHPDRNASAEAADRFREAADANDVLRSYLDVEADDVSAGTGSCGYETLMKSLLSSVFGDPASCTAVSFLCENMRGRGLDMALRALDSLDRRTAFEVLGYVSAYRDVLGIEDEVMARLHARVVGSSTARVVLNPTIDNLLNKDVYCLKTDERTIYVPLWHEEIVYEVSGNPMVMTISLDLPDGVAIDHNNDLHVRVRCPAGKALSERVIPVSVGGKAFELQSDQLHLRAAQTARIRNVGVPRINTSDLLDASTLGDIVVHLELY